jgi:hypothetical protein
MGVANRIPGDDFAPTVAGAFGGVAITWWLWHTGALRNSAISAIAMTFAVAAGAIASVLLTVREYRRDPGISGTAAMLLGMNAQLIAYILARRSRAGPSPTRILDQRTSLLAAGVSLAGVYALYWGWEHRDGSNTGS